MSAFDDLLNAQGAGATPAPAQQSAFRDLLNGGGAEMRSTTKAPREIGDTLAKSPSFWTQVRASLPPDDQVKIKRFAAAMNIPEQRFGIVDGNIVYSDDKGDIHRVTPSVFGGKGAGETFMRAGRFVGSEVGPQVPQVAATGAGVASSSILGGIPGAAAVGGAVDAGRQWLDKLLAGESGGIDWLNSLGHAAEAGAGQALGLGITKAVNRNPLQVGKYDRAQALDPRTAQRAQALQNRAERFGIDTLTPGDTTGLPSLRVNERQLGRYPETANQMAARREKQDGQIQTAVQNEISKISPVESTEQGAKMMREGALGTIKKAEGARSAAATPAYEKALDNPDRFWNEDIDKLMSRPSMEKGLSYAKRMAAEEGKDITVPVFENGKLVGRDTVPDWRSWDYIKRGLDAIIEEETNQFGKVSAYGRLVTKTKRELLEKLDRANPEYAAARKAFSDKSPEVTELTDGPVGIVAKESAVDLARRNGTLLDFHKITPEATRRARAAFVNAGHENEWNAGVRSYIEDRISAVEAKAGNYPGALHKELFADERARNVMREAMGDERYQGFRQLMRVIESAGRKLPEGSPTATDLNGGVQGFSLVAKAFKMLSPQEIGGRVGDALDERATSEMRRKVLDAVLKKDNLKALKELRLMSPTSEKATMTAAQILTATGIGTSGARTLGQPEIEPGAP